MSQLEKMIMFAGKSGRMDMDELSLEEGAQDQQKKVVLGLERVSKKELKAVDERPNSNFFMASGPESPSREIKMSKNLTKGPFDFRSNLALVLLVLLLIVPIDAIGCCQNCLDDPGADPNFHNFSYPILFEYSPIGKYYCQCKNGYFWVEQYYFEGVFYPASCKPCSTLPHFQNLSDSCQCEAGYTYVIWKGCQIDCSIPNSSGRRSATMCSCNLGYIYNPVAHLCEVLNCANILDTDGDNSLASSGICTCASPTRPAWSVNFTACQKNCSALGDIGFISFMQTSDPDVCGCDYYFSLWNQTATRQQCVLDCRFLVNTDGSFSVDGVNCRCKQPFVWSLSLMKCIINCSSVTYATGNANDYGCDCRGQHGSFSYGRAACIYNCVVIPHTQLDPEQGVWRDDGGCYCQHLYIWNTTSVRCEWSCSLIPNANFLILTVDGYCVCNSGYVWNSSTMLCDVQPINCSSIPFTDEFQNPEMGYCHCIAWYMWNGSFCELSCSDIPHAVSVINMVECICEPTFFWHCASKTCWINCSLVDNANPQQLTTNECNCLPNYTWSDGKCVPQCSQIQYTLPQSATPPCNCIDKFYWNEVTRLCEINCSYVSNSNGPSTFETCFCQPNAYFNATLLECLFNCSRIPNTNTSVITFNVTCACKTKYKWNITTRSCQIDCTVIPRTHHDFQAIDDNFCVCQVYNVWDQASLSCLIYCVDIENANSTVVRQAKVKCICNRYYTWNDSALACNLDCSKISKALNSPSVDGVCLCQTDYLWNNSTKTCNINCAGIFGTSSPPAPRTATSCFCRTNFVWSGAHFCCSPQCNRLPRTNGILDTQTGKSCGCNSGFSWSMTPTPGCH